MRTGLYYEPGNTYPAREDRAVFESASKAQIDARTMTNQTAFTGVCVWRFIFFHHLEPGRALSLAKAKTTRDASTTCAAPVTYCLGIIVSFKLYEGH